LTKKQFKHDFFCGLGSALLELKACESPQRYYDIVLYSCLHNTTYDMQCEGDRGWYLYQAARLVGEKEAIESAVIQKFFQIRENYSLFNQITSILYHFAMEGSETARAVLYQCKCSIAGTCGTLMDCSPASIRWTITFISSVLQKRFLI